MIKVFFASWALFLGMFMLMVGNGLQGTLLGVRGDIENFSTFQMSLVMSAYFIGFLGGSRLAPDMIRRVGHVRVFAALGSTISAVLILYPVLTEVWAWILGRIVIGFCFSGVYVTAESWLNNAASNENRGQSLSVYMLAQMSGIVVAQGILSVGDVEGYILFIIPSVLVSLAFAPILLSVSPTPSFETARPVSALSGGGFVTLLIGAAIVGGTSNPLYALYIAYANDFLEHEDMPGASAGFIFINGVGAILGPILLGFVMGQFGESAFWVVVAGLMLLMAAYGAVRVLQRPSDWDIEDVTPYAPVMANASPFAVDMAQEVYIETELEEQAQDVDQKT